MKKLASTSAKHCKTQASIDPGSNLCEDLQIDPQEIKEGVSAAKYRVAQRLRHLEKTRDQKAPTTVKKTR